MKIRWANRWHKGFNRLLLVVALILSVAAFIALIDESEPAWVKFLLIVGVFVVVWGGGHIALLAVYWIGRWIIEGFRKE